MFLKPLHYMALHRRTFEMNSSFFGSPELQHTFK